MSDQKALTDGSSGGLGRLNEDLAMPPGAKPIGTGWMSGLMGRLTARTQRRGSLGFNDGGLSTPPARIGSQDEIAWEGWEEGRGQLGKQRNDSFNFLSSTPGGDGDQYHFKQRFRRNNSESQDMSSLVGTDWEEETYTTSTLTNLPVSQNQICFDIRSNNHKQLLQRKRSTRLKWLIWRVLRQTLGLLFLKWCILVHILRFFFGAVSPGALHFFGFLLRSI